MNDSEPNPLLDAALAYASKHWKVFPLRPGSKEPYPGSRGFHDATDDPETIRRWWSEHPDAWVAAWCRGSGLLVVDVDPKNGGEETLARAEERYGALPRALVQRTPSGGIHVVMADPSPGGGGWTRPGADGGEVRGRLDKLGLGRGADVKCNGYILLEPSGKYEWESWGDPPSVPERWLAALRKPAAELAAPADGLGAWEHPSDPGELPAADLARLRADLTELGPRGSGKSTTFRATARIFHDYGLSVDQGWPLMLEWNKSCGHPRGESEIARQVERVAAHGLRGGRGSRRSDISPLARIARAAPASDDAESEPAAQSREQSVAKLVPERAGDQGFADVWNEVAQDLVPLLTKSKVSESREPRRHGMSGRQIKARNAPPPIYLVDGLIVEGGLTALSAEPKSGKSWDMTHITIALASGKPVFGRFAVPRVVGTYYHYAEDPESSIRVRMTAIAAGMGLDPDGDWLDRWFAQPRGEQLDVLSDFDLCTLVTSVLMLQIEHRVVIRFVALDPLSDIHSGEEDKRDSMALVMHRFRTVSSYMSRRAGMEIGVGFLHHSKKDDGKSKKRGGQKMRGSSSIHGAVDNGLYIDDLRGDRKCKFVGRMESELKSARGGGVFERTIDIEDVDGRAVKATWTTSECQEAEASRDLGQERSWGILQALFAKQVPLSCAAIRNVVKGDLLEVRRLLEDLKKDGLVSQSMSGRQSRGWSLTDAGRETVRNGQIS